MVAVTVNQTSYTKYRALKLPQKRNKIEFLKTLRLFSEIRIPIDVISFLVQLIICYYSIMVVIKVMVWWNIHDIEKGCKLHWYHTFLKEVLF